ncbi:hypothetical protein DLREEDagr8_14920 [Dongia sp. agr-C8]
MWPYNDEEAGWLKPRERAEPPRRITANDNETGHRVPDRTLARVNGSVADPNLPPKS